MKMATEDYNLIKKAFEVHSTAIVNHYNEVKESGDFKVLDVRVAWDCLRAFLGTKWICNQYGKGLNDSHIQTACVKALKEVVIPVTVPEGFRNWEPEI